MDLCKGEGEARFMDVRVSAKGIMMVVAVLVNAGARAYHFISGHASSGTSLIRSCHCRPFDILFGRSKVWGHSLALVLLVA